MRKTQIITPPMKKAVCQNKAMRASAVGIPGASSLPLCRLPRPMSTGHGPTTQRPLWTRCREEVESAVLERDSHRWLLPPGGEAGPRGGSEIGARPFRVNRGAGHGQACPGLVTIFFFSLASTRQRPHSSGFIYELGKSLASRVPGPLPRLHRHTDRSPSRRRLPLRRTRRTAQPPRRCRRCPRGVPSCHRATPAPGSVEQRLIWRAAARQVPPCIL